jgi:hypothetical protein
MTSEREIVLRKFREAHEGDGTYKHLTRSRTDSLNPFKGKQTTDPEAVDYRYQEEAGTGEGSVSQPEGPSEI